MLRVEATERKNKSSTHPDNDYHLICDNIATPSLISNDNTLVHYVKYQHIYHEEWDYNSSAEEDDCEDQLLKQIMDLETKTALFTVTILQTTVTALADSGATVSLCSEGLWKQINKILSHPKITPVRNIILVDFSGTRRKCVLGEVILPLNISGQDLYFRFLIVKGLRHTMLIGKDFLSMYDVQLDFHQGRIKMKIQGHCIEVPMVKDNEEKETLSAQAIGMSDIGMCSSETIEQIPLRYEEDQLCECEADDRCAQLRLAPDELSHNYEFFLVTEW